MPINGQCGFVFLNNVSAEGVARIAAHELGHGVFRLYHTFSSDNCYVLPVGTTDNLMDYNGGTALYKYQWDYIHDPQTMLFAWAEEEEEGAYIDENCFKDPNNFDKFKIFYDPLKKDTIFMKVFRLLDNSTKLAYCFDELTSEEIEESTTPKGTIGGFTEPYEKAIFIGMRSTKTHKKYWFKEALAMQDENLLDLIKSEEWKGRIGINMNLISSYVIFHELNHAVQYLLELEGKGQYTGALREVETRMICFYAAFLKADESTRKDYLKMREFLKSYYNNSNIEDLMPLTGSNLLIKKSSETGEILSDKEIYTIIYKFFSGLNNNGFDQIMIEYATYLKNYYGYTYKSEEFKPIYYLYNLIK
jgi:hypothetical protein